MPASPSIDAPSYHPLRLNRVTFRVSSGNAVLPAGHTYTQYAHVGRAYAGGRWCFVAGVSAP